MINYFTEERVDLAFKLIVDPNIVRNNPDELLTIVMALKLALKGPPQIILDSCFVESRDGEAVLNVDKDGNLCITRCQIIPLEKWQEKMIVECQKRMEREPLFNHMIRRIKYFYKWVTE